MRHLIHACLVTMLVSFAPLLAQSQPVGAAAQETSVALDSRWLPWLGCWQSESERLAGDDARLCVVPAGTGNPQAVRLLVIIEGVVANEQVMAADGSPVPVSERGCSGDRRVSWSSRGTSRFSRMQLNCQVGPPLRASGLSMITMGAVWLTIEVTQSYGREIVEVLKYSRATVPPLLADVLTPDLIAKAWAASDALAGLPLDLQDVIEAGTAIAPGAIEIALIETNTAIPINRRSLITLADAKVPGTVIDLLVALAYPDKFLISRPTPATGWEMTLAYSDGWFDPTFAEYPSDPIYFVYYPDGGGDSVGPAPGAKGAALAVNGKGYVQVRPAGEVVPHGNGGSGNGGGISPASASGGESGGSSSNASASSSGYVGGGGGDTGRTAVSR